MLGVSHVAMHGQHDCSQLPRLFPEQKEPVTISHTVSMNCLVTLASVILHPRHRETLFSGRACQGLGAQFSRAGQGQC